MRVFIGRTIQAVLIAVFSYTASFAATAGPHWEAVRAQVPAGVGVRLDVRLIGVDGKPLINNVTIIQTRLDMGPDNMQAMTSPVRQVPSSQPGVTSFQADLSRGRWALTISANIAGQNQPVTGQVVFTAVAER